jgi:hypothetical protein
MARLVARVHRPGRVDGILVTLEQLLRDPGKSLVVVSGDHHKGIFTPGEELGFVKPSQRASPRIESSSAGLAMANMEKSGKQPSEVDISSK